MMEARLVDSRDATILGLKPDCGESEKFNLNCIHHAESVKHT